MQRLVPDSSSASILIYAAFVVLHLTSSQRSDTPYTCSVLREQDQLQTNVSAAMYSFFVFTL
ncbi:hypothetical protein E2C01_046102 [Portunus trituberculatus]|uniref:Uncharacterized protein n=1 Tax=Portunus trituberculatus TaxID=210409 RepID=A0A5B7G3W4_PORTR|nr:hypothetical protein [Portunus trituberculatus]